MKAKIYITLKNGVLDPQGRATHGALESLGFNSIKEVRQGKFIEVELLETSKDKAKEVVEQMCQKLLANMVIENYKYEIA